MKDLIIVLSILQGIQLVWAIKQGYSMSRNRNKDAPRTLHALIALYIAVTWPVTLLFEIAK